MIKVRRKMLVIFITFFLVTIYFIHRSTVQQSIRNRMREPIDTNYKALDIKSNLSLRHFEYYEETCMDLSIPNRQCGHNVLSWQDFERPWTSGTLNGVVLVVTFNNPIYKVIPTLELLYRPFFSRIIYCGPRPITSDENGYNVPFIRYNHFQKSARQPPGSGMYACMAMAMAKYAKDDIRGYLLASDDVLTIVPNIFNLSLGKIWFFRPQTFEIYDLNNDQKVPNNLKGDWGKFSEQKRNLLRVLEDLKYLFDQKARQCHRSIENFTGGKSRVFGRVIADFFYVPKHLSGDFRTLAGIFHQRNIFLEIAVPMILLCIHDDPDNPSDPWVPLTTGVHVASRFPPWEYFESPLVPWNVMFLHPIKWSCLHEERRCQELLCHTVLPILHNKQIHTNPNCRLSSVIMDESYIHRNFDEAGRPIVLNTKDLK